MNVAYLHQEILKKLRANQRPQLRLSKSEVEEIIREWKKCQFTSSKEARPLLSILNHCRGEFHEFIPLITEVLRTIENPEILIFTLSAFRKHVIEFYQKRGERIPQEILENLGPPLKHPNLEVLEWTLRTLELLGGQGLRFKESLLQRRPTLFQSFCPKYRVIKKLIETILQTRKGGVHNG